MNFQEGMEVYTHNVNFLLTSVKSIIMYMYKNIFRQNFSFCSTNNHLKIIINSCFTYNHFKSCGC